MPHHVVCLSVLVAAAAAFSGCGLEQDKYSAYELTPQAQLTDSQTPALPAGCTKLVTNLGTYADEKHCHSYLAGVKQDPAKSYECLEHKATPSCK